MNLFCLGEADEGRVRRLVPLVGEGDTILLVGSAVGCARRGHTQLDALAASGASLHALAEDLALYGVQCLDERISAVDYSGWVKLAMQHERQLLWR